MKSLNSKHIDISLWALLFTLFVVIYINFSYSHWNNQKRVIIHDIFSYYAYLPATFIYGDISLQSIENKKEKLGGGFYGKRSPTGNTVIITSCGMSSLYLPFFLVAHTSAQKLGYKADGYSTPYKFALVMSSIFYLIIGSIFLRKFLLKYFSSLVVAITLVTIILTTNLLWYVTVESPMSHIYSFSLISIFLYITDKWLQTSALKYSIIIGLLAGIISLIRPTNIIVVVLLVLWKVSTWDDLSKRILFFISKWYQIVLILVLFFIVWSPQFLYWKYVAGSYFFYSYPESQGFYFLNPQFYNTLFSWRKGLFIYTPVMFFAIAGIGLLYKSNKGLFWPVSVYFLISWYIISSWWDWWYGGSFGLRAFIDSYGIYSIGLATFITWVLKVSRQKKIIFITLFVLSAMLSMWHYLRYKGGSIHWVAMTKEAYFDSFWQVHPTVKYYEKLRKPDYKLARKGIYKYKDETEDKPSK
ncbi:MAG: hypothetical protein QM487_10740 [Candidatus Marithrix sp.]